MDSNSFLPLSDSIQLPVIDFSDQILRPGTSKWDKVKADVRKALEDYGCFEAFFDKVSVDLDKSVFEAMEELFDLPVQTKQRNVGTMHGFSEQLAKLDVMVRRMLIESFGIEKYIDEHLNSTNYLFRMMKYTAPPDDDGGNEETKLGLRSHTDKNILTILHQYQVDGLEIQTKDEKWIKAFLNGRLSSPYHRVLMTAKKTRYSTALFSVPKSGVIIDSPEELVDEEHPRMFKPFEYNDYRDFFNTEAGRTAQSTLHAFCAL
ncbi:hypothetical protein Bca101_018941 [Brassica carinata]